MSHESVHLPREKQDDALVERVYICYGGRNIIQSE
jgi:hypothetical protein